MKTLSWKLALVAALFWVTAASRTVAATEDNVAGSADRIQQLEQRVNMLAERQDQLMRQLSEPEHPLPGSPPDVGNVRRPWGAPGMPAPMAKGHNGLHGLIGLMIFAGMICNILLAIWIFTDIRKRGEGSGIFIALALVAGIPTAIIYALVRIGDKKA